VMKTPNFVQFRDFKVVVIILARLRVHGRYYYNNHSGSVSAQA